MRSIHNLTKRLEKLESVTRARYAPPNCAILLYDTAKHDEAWKEAKIARSREQGTGYIKTIILIPSKETVEENATRHAAMRAENRL